jgi:hypothetical protein
MLVDSGVSQRTRWLFDLIYSPKDVGASWGDEKEVSSRETGNSVIDPVFMFSQFTILIDPIHNLLLFKSEQKWDQATETVTPPFHQPRCILHTINHAFASLMIFKSTNDCAWNAPMFLVSFSVNESFFFQTFQTIFDLGLSRC